MADNNIKKINNKASLTATVNFYSLLTIGEVDVPSESILNLHLYEWIFDIIPRIDIVLNDSGTFNEKYPIVDGTPIKLEYSINEDTENLIVVNFVAESVSIENSNTGENTSSLVRIVGVLKNNKLLFPLISQAFEDQPSSKVIETIAKNTGFTPDIRIQTSDNMTWLQTHLSNGEMIKDITDRAFLSEADSVFCFTNRNSEMVYTSIETEAANESKFIAMYSALATSHPGNMPEDDATKEVITYNSLDYKSLAPIVNKNMAYGSNVSYYDGNNNTSINLDSDIHSMSTTSLKNKAHAGEIVDHNVYGIENNVHQNYFRSLSENRYIKQGFFSAPIMINSKPNNNLNLFDKIDLTVNSQDGLSTNDVLSGKYLVGGIVHHFSKDGIYNTLLTVFRNGLEPPTFDKDFELNLTS
jgi:hypothetical protein